MTSDLKHEPLEKAKELAAQCWCTKATSGIDIDPIVAEEVAKAIDIWMRATVRRQHTIDRLEKELDQLREVIKGI